MNANQSPPKSAPQQPVAKQQQNNPIADIGKTIGLALVLALGIRTFVAEARYIPSGSMLPTLQINDRLIVDKISYRFSEPKRGDIIVFNLTDALKQRLKNEKDLESTAFIKRIIGLPGDRVQVKQGKVYINGKTISEQYLGEAARYEWSSSELTADGSGKVPSDNYLVLGDNRNQSNDSRYWGFVPRAKIVGKAAVRFWPINRAGGIDPQPDYK
jgi:signal peptidase I